MRRTTLRQRWTANCATGEGRWRKGRGRGSECNSKTVYATVGSSSRKTMCDTHRPNISRRQAAVSCQQPMTRYAMHGCDSEHLPGHVTNHHLRHIAQSAAVCVCVCVAPNYLHDLVPRWLTSGATWMIMMTLELPLNGDFYSNCW